MKINLQEIRWRDGEELSGSGQGRAAGTIDCGYKPSVSVKCRALASQEGVCSMEEKEEEEKEEEILEKTKGFVKGINKIKKYSST